MDLTFGVFVPQGWKMELSTIPDPVAKWQKAVEVAELAEALGYDSLWVYDHFHNVPVPAHETMFECWTTLAAISQRTERIKLGQGEQKLAQDQEAHQDKTVFDYTELAADQAAAVVQQQVQSQQADQDRAFTLATRPPPGMPA